MKINYDSEILISSSKRLMKKTEINNIFLVSQIQRSGGTLLLQLLDGHPDIFVHPSELHIGRPNKYFWPNLDLEKSPVRLFKDLVEVPMINAARKGYSKDGVSQNFLHRLIYFPKLHEKIFLTRLEIAKHRSDGKFQQHIVLGAFFSSFFASWLDYEIPHAKKTKIMVGHLARFIISREEVNKFYADFPKGRIISIIRDPVSWYASALRYKPDEYGDLHKSISLYRKCVSEAIYQREQGRQCILIDFQNLVAHPRKTLRRLEKKLGLSFSSSAIPTFNAKPIQSNSSFESVNGLVDQSPLDRSSFLEEEVKKTIKEELDDLYGKALEKCSF